MALLCLYVSAQVGSLDLTFNTSGTPGFRIDNPAGSGAPDQYDFGTAMAFQPDGKILVGGRSSDGLGERFVLVRYTAQGALDNTFGTNGAVWVRSETNNAALGYGMVLQPDGKIVMAGWNWPNSDLDFCLMRFNSDGSFDNSFGTLGKVTTNLGPGNDEARNLALQPDGKIVVTGLSFNASGNADYVVARYTTAGTLDNTFGTGGFVRTDINSYDVAESIAINSTTGAITIGGTSNSDYDFNGSHHSGNGDFTVVRYTSAGVLDNTFGTGGKVTVDMITGQKDEAHSLAVQPDGKLIVAGTTKSTGNHDVALIRLTTAGALDASFGTGGKVFANYVGSNSDDDCRSVALQSDGKLIIGGSVDAFPNTTGRNPFGFMLMRFTSAGVLDPSFDGDGKTAVNLSITDNDNGLVVGLNGSTIYLAGNSGQPMDFAIAAIQNDVAAPLPLVLSQFYAQKQTSKVVLQWQTTSEEDLKQFVIERSNDGKTYKAIGTVAAAGNSNTKSNYSYADGSPFMSTNNYYRLLMQDVDGNYKYSKTLIIKFDGQLSTNMQVFPSNVKDMLQVQLPNGLNGNVSLQIIDMSGRVIKKNTLASDGNALSTTMDVSTLVNGVYILKAQAGNTSLITRFTKN
jgi:uncharacterized delta-60 repeat protein